MSATIPPEIETVLDAFPIYGGASERFKELTAQGMAEERARIDTELAPTELSERDRFSLQGLLHEIEMQKINLQSMAINAEGAPNVCLVRWFTDAAAKAETLERIAKGLLRGGK